MAVAFSPASSLRLKPHHIALRFLSLLPSKATPSSSFLLNAPKTLTTYRRFSPLLSPPSPCQSVPRRRCFCNLISTALSPAGEIVDSRKSPENADADAGSGKVGEFRKRLRIVDIKGGHNEGLDRLGQNLVVRGWVRTIRMQSSVTFIEVGFSFWKFLFNSWHWLTLWVDGW